MMCSPARLAMVVPAHECRLRVEPAATITVIIIEVSSIGQQYPYPPGASSIGIPDCHSIAIFD